MVCFGFEPGDAGLKSHTTVYLYVKERKISVCLRMDIYVRAEGRARERKRESLSVFPSCQSNLIKNLNFHVS